MLHSPGYQFGVGPQTVWKPLQRSHTLLAQIEWFVGIKFPVFGMHLQEGSGSTKRLAVEQRVASSRLTASGVTVVSLSKTLKPLLNSGSIQEDRSQDEWKNAYWDIKHQNKQVEWKNVWIMLCLLLRSQLIWIYTIFKTGYIIWVH